MNKPVLVFQGQDVRVVIIEDRGKPLTVVEVSDGIDALGNLKWDDMKTVSPQRLQAAAIELADRLADAISGRPEWDMRTTAGQGT